MKDRVQLPGVPLWNLLALVGAVATGWWIYTTQEASVPELDAKALDIVSSHATFDSARALETQRIDTTLPTSEVFAPEVTLAPNPGRPCPSTSEGASSAIKRSTASALRKQSAQELAQVARRHRNHWLPSLTYGAFLLEEDRVEVAARVLEPAAARAKFIRGQNVDEPPDQIFGYIYMLHALGYSEIRNRSHQVALVENLRYAMNWASYLGNLGHTSRPAGDPYWYDHRLRRPGCPAKDPQLSTFDLSNNLIQLYLQLEYQEPDPDRQNREFYREYADSPERNPLQLALQRGIVSRLATEESRIWALSNVERLARNRRAVRLGPPDDTRLALTMAQVMSESSSLLSEEPRAPAAQRALWREIAEYVTAIEGRKNGAPETPAGFSPALIRLELLSHVEGFPLESLASVEDPSLQSTRTAILEATRLRHDASTLSALLLGNESLDLSILAANDWEIEPWIKALRLDAAEGLARGADGSARDRVELLLLAMDLVQDQSVPPEVAALRNSLDWSEQLKLWMSHPGARAVVAVATGLLILLLLRWWALQMKMRKALFTSFYNLEAEARSRGGR